MDKLMLSSGVDPPFVDLATSENSASSASMSFSDSEPAVQDGGDASFVDLVTRENSANSDSMVSAHSAPAFQDAQPLRQLLPKPGMDMAELVRRLSPIDLEEGPEPDTPINPEDLQLSFHSVSEVMRKALRPGIKIMVQAKIDMQQYASEFISFITSEAAERVYREHREVIEGSDILVAMEDTGFEHYAGALRPYLEGLLGIERIERLNESPVSEVKDEEDTDVVAAQNGGSTESLPCNESPVSEAKDGEETDAAVVQHGETAESPPWDHALGPFASTAGDVPDTWVPSSANTFPWVYPWVPKD